MPRPAVVALLERSAEALGRPDFGLRLAGVQDVHILGALSFAIRHAPDLRASIATVVAHAHYHAPQVAVTIATADANEERILFHQASSHAPPAGAQMTEHGIGLFCRIYRHVTGGRFRPAGIDFVHVARSSSDVYVEHLGVAPRFSADAVAVRVDRRDLALPLKTSNPQFQALVERYLELNSPHVGPDVSKRVHQAVWQVMRHGNASIDDVASMLHMHARTLQRRLMEEGTTFERVRDDVRRRLAEVYLANEVVPLVHVAQLLGYSNQSVLTRSCLRWFGKTPLAMRQDVIGIGR